MKIDNKSRIIYWRKGKKGKNKKWKINEFISNEKKNKKKSDYLLNFCQFVNNFLALLLCKNNVHVIFTVWLF